MTRILPFEVQVHEVDAAVRGDGAVIVDVRQRWEWEESHVPGAVLIPLGELVARLPELPADRDVFVMCRMGGRSAQAVEYLRSTGLSRTANVAGGMEAWEAAGLPVE